MMTNDSKIDSKVDSTQSIVNKGLKGSGRRKKSLIPHRQIPAFSRLPDDDENGSIKTGRTYAKEANEYNAKNGKNQ